MPTKVRIVKAMVFPVIMYGYESWTIKKAEHWRIDLFEQWCWRNFWESLGLQGDQTSQSQRKSTMNIHWKDWCWSWRSNTSPDVKNWLTGKDPVAGKDRRQEEKGTTEDEMAGWHYRLNGHDFEQAPGDGEGKPGVLRSMGSQRVGHYWAIEQQQQQRLICFKKLRDLPGSPVVKTSSSNAGVWILFLVGELRSPLVLAPIPNRKQKQYCNKFNNNF